jgi:hypothetical protein
MSEKIIRQIRFGYIYGIIGFYKDPQRVAVFNYHPDNVSVSYGSISDRKKILLYNRHENDDMLRELKQLKKEKKDLEFYIIKFTSKRAKMMFNIKNCVGWNKTYWAECELKKDVDFFKMKVYRALP